MNLKDLMDKMTAIEEGIEIIGGPMGLGHEEPPKQADSVSMSVNMNGQGATGIKDLMSILRSIEQGDNADPHAHDVSQLFGEPDEHEEPIMGNMVNDMDPQHDLEHGVEEEMGSAEGETWGNSAQGDSGVHTRGIEAVTGSGDDLNRSKKQYPGVANRAANPIHEGLVERLQNLYNEIKTRSLNEGCLQDPHKHALAHILMADRHGHNQLTTTGQAPHDLYEKLYDYYWDDMPAAVKKHPDHKVRHDHVVGRCKADMMTPECQTSMSSYAPMTMTAPTVSIAEDQDIEQD